MSFPLPFTASHLAHSAGATDDFGNAADSWAAGVDVACFWWSPEVAEPALPGHSRIVVDLVIVLDSADAATVKSRDRFVIDSLTFEVDGQAQDFDHGPFGWAPNRRPISLKRVEG